MIVPEPTLTRQRYRIRPERRASLSACADWLEDGEAYEGDIDPSSQESATAQIRLFHPSGDGRSCLMDETCVEEAD